jgi:DNA modification methylase
MDPLWQLKDGSVKLYHGSVFDVLPELPRRSVQCVATSPPYWGVRDYGTAVWTGGRDDCDHEPPNDWFEKQFRAKDTANISDGTVRAAAKRRWYKTDGSCPMCGAVRVDEQIGSEPSPDCGTQGQAQCDACFVCHMVKFGRCVRRVLRDDGTFWLNLGDTYASSGGHTQQGRNSQRKGMANVAVQNEAGTTNHSGLVTGNLVGVPWRVALALQADGWVLRQDVIWHKPSPMPESVKNRCTKAHEYIFLLTKSKDYFYDHVAIQEDSKRAGDRPGGSKYSSDEAEDPLNRNPHTAATLNEAEVEDTKNKRSVWTVAAQGYPGAHYATFPPKLILPMILAGTSERGACAACGAPYRRVVEEQKLTRERPNDYVKRTGEQGTGNSCANTVAGVRSKTIGWEKTCECETNEVRPCVVLDPFVGSGTVPSVCRQFGRAGWGIDLSEKYLRENAIPRIEATPPVGNRAEVKPRVKKKDEGGFFK